MGLHNVSNNPSAYAVRTNIAASTGSVALVSGAYDAVIIYNDSTATLYLGYGDRPVSGWGAGGTGTADFSFSIPPTGKYESPKNYFQGTINGFWSSAVGTGKITKIS
jgi:hypothetical protein